MIQQLAIAVIVLAAMLPTSPADGLSSGGESIRRDEQKLAAADALEKQFVGPLELKGKTARAAVDAMMSQGFRCGISPESKVPGLELPPVVACLKQVSDLNTACFKLKISFFVDWPDEHQTGPALFRQLPLATVKQYTSFCPYPVAVEQKFLAPQIKAQADLGKYASAFDLPGKDAASAFETLLSAGFDCGFDADGNADASKPMQTGLICSNRRPLIKDCLEPSLRLSLSWPEPAVDDAHLAENLSAAKVTALEPVCVIPALRGPGANNFTVPQTRQ